MKRVVLEHLFPNVGQALQSLVQSGVQLCEVQTDDVVDTLLAEERGTGKDNLGQQIQCSILGLVEIRRHFGMS